MARLFWLFGILLFCGCQGHSEKQSGATSEIEAIKTPNKVQVQQLADGVWVHTTLYDIPGTGIVPSNGMAVRHGDTLILIDTAWGEIATHSLVKQLEAKTGLPVTQVIITNYHHDRLAGVDWLEAQGARVFTHPDTPQLSAALGTPIPNTSVAALKLPGSRSALGPVEISFPGPTHSPDNLMVYIKDKKILFAGRAVRSTKTQGLGNVKDADLSKWGPSLAWVKRTYPGIKIVVPSHGQVGDNSLIDHTMALIAQHVNAKSENENESESAD